MFSDTLPQQKNYTDICKCNQKCDRVSYDVQISQAPFSDDAIVEWIFADSLPDLGVSLRNLRQLTNLDIMNRNFTLHINSISRMYLQLRDVFYSLGVLFALTSATVYSSPVRSQCVASSLPFYEASMDNFTEWEMRSYYLNITATRSNDPRVDDFLTILAHDIISQSNEMYRFISELNHMVGAFNIPVESLTKCFGQAPLIGQEIIIAGSLQNAMSVINSSSSLTLAINDSYTALSDSIRSHKHFSWLIKEATDTKVAIRWVQPL